MQQAGQHHCSLRNEGVQQICQIDVAHFPDVKFATFNARNAVNDVGGGACKIVRITKWDLDPEIDVAELRNEHV